MSESHPAALAPASYGCGGALVLPGATLQNQRGDAVAHAVLIVCTGEPLGLELLVRSAGASCWSGDFCMARWFGPLDCQPGSEAGNGGYLART
jgi:hypothetical protein